METIPRSWLRVKSNKKVRHGGLFYSVVLSVCSLAIFDILLNSGEFYFGHRFAQIFLDNLCNIKNLRAKPAKICVRF